MAEYSLSDEQWCLLDVLVHARQKGIRAVSRKELLSNSALPQGVAVRLVWAALTMPSEILQMEGQHDFVLTDEGEALFNLRFRKPTAIAEAVICLPGPEGYLH